MNQLVKATMPLSAALFSGILSRLGNFFTQEFPLASEWFRLLAAGKRDP